MQLGAARVPYGGAYTRSERWDHCNTDRLPQHLHGHSRSVPERGQGDWFGGAHLVRHRLPERVVQTPRSHRRRGHVARSNCGHHRPKDLGRLLNYSEDKEYAQAELLAIRVPPGWLLPPS